MAKPTIPREVIEKLLARTRPPLIAVFDGPGPFQLPPMQGLVSLDMNSAPGASMIRLETSDGQEVRIPISERVWKSLLSIARAMQDHDARLAAEAAAKATAH